MTPIVVPYIIPYITPFKEFRLQLILGFREILELACGVRERCIRRCMHMCMYIKCVSIKKYITFHLACDFPLDPPLRGRNSANYLNLMPGHTKHELVRSY